uniref:ribosomal protein L20 n=1 Tax=Hypnea cervicornis TaxID=387623 RepID=UPI0021B56671|nr:ribosomal protein L20 [Hypnea cervicornis]UVW80583.1 ribosomal protein L20 [Hypnea cervicornis]
MLKQNFYKTKRLQSKRKFLNKITLRRLNFYDTTKYNFFYFFIQSEKVILNKKILWLLYSTEKGSIFSLKKWIKFIMFTSY